MRHARDAAERAVEDVLWGYGPHADLKNDKRFRYILIFKNHVKPPGDGRSSAFAVDRAADCPRRVREEVDNCWHYYDEKERCIFCDIIRQNGTPASG